MFTLISDEDFERYCSKLDHSEQIRVKKILNQIMERGDEVGDPLSGLSFLREKRINGKRLYFLVYKNLNTVLALTISDKKAQRITIRKILLDLDYYHKYVLEALKRKGLP